MPDAIWAVSRLPPDLSRSPGLAPVSTPLKFVTTRHQRFAHARLPDPHLTRSRRAFFPQRSPRTALNRRSLRWFGISPCRATPEDLPPSLPHSTASSGFYINASFSVRDTRAAQTRRICLRDRVSPLEKHPVPQTNPGLDPATHPHTRPGQPLDLDHPRRPHPTPTRTPPHPRSPPPMGETSHPAPPAHPRPHPPRIPEPPTENHPPRQRTKTLTTRARTPTRLHEPPARPPARRRQERHHAHQQGQSRLNDKLRHLRSAAALRTLTPNLATSRRNTTA
jgi:hypothetical protein